MQSVGEILKQYKKEILKQRNSPVNFTDILSHEFLRLPLPLLNAILFDHRFTKRQIKILLFISRFSIGCRRSTALLKRVDFKQIRIHPSDINHELKTLVNENFIGWKKPTNRLWVTQKLLGNSPTKENKKVSEILTRNLVKHQQDVGNLPTQKSEYPYQKGKIRTDRYKINIDKNYRYTKPIVNKYD